LKNHKGPRKPSSATLLGGGSDASVGGHRGGLQDLGPGKIPSLHKRSCPWNDNSAFLNSTTERFAKRPTRAACLGDLVVFHGESLELDSGNVAWKTRLLRQKTSSEMAEGQKTMASIFRILVLPLKKPPLLRGSLKRKVRAGLKGGLVLGEAVRKKQQDLQIRQNNIQLSNVKPRQKLARGKKVERPGASHCIPAERGSIFQVLTKENH